MVCSVCGERFSVARVTVELKLRHNVDYSDLPDDMCYDCAMEYVEENSVTLFEGSDYDPDDPDTYW